MKNLKDKYSVLYVTKNDGTDTRMSKECNSLLAAGYNVMFLGWDRSPHGIKSEPIPKIKKYILKHAAGYRTIRSFSSYWRYVFFVLKILSKTKPNIVHAVNEDLAFMLVFLKPFFRYKLVCDIYDSFSLRYTHSTFLVRKTVNLFCNIAWQHSDLIIVTDLDRLGRLKLPVNKTAVVPNYPVDPCELKPINLEKASERIYLYVSGTLYSARGLRQLEALLEKTTNVYVLCAGWLYDNSAEAFVRHPKVEFIGVITPGESLAYAAACDAVIALYQPTDENMLFASPNKIYDAMCVGRPVIINRETRVSKWVIENNLGFSCSYWDEEELQKIVEKLESLKSDEHQRQAIRRLFESGYSWDVAATEMLRHYNCLF